MKASEMLAGIGYKLMMGDLDVEVLDLVDDSRKVTEGAVFICRKGNITDGHSYIDDAMARGAVGIVITEDIEAADNHISGGHVENGIRKSFVAKLEDSRDCIGQLCNNFWNYPSHKLMMIGITGTKGKTTVAYMLRSVLREAKVKTGLIGTVEIDDGVTVSPAVNTTPGTVCLYRKIADMVDNDVEVCVMEVSSQGLMLGRVDGVDFDIGIITNISPDHIGKCEHATFEEYVRWKSSLMGMCRGAVINTDDKYSPEFYFMARMQHTPIWTYGVKHYRRMYTAAKDIVGDYRAYHVENYNDRGCIGTVIEVEGNKTGIGHITLGVPGMFNVYNAVAVCAVGDMLGIPEDILNSALCEINIPGRFERITKYKGLNIYIDYAHNAASLENILKTLRKYTNGRIICLFGCGGGRARNRRAGMGSVAGKLADITIITSDNPRNENPETIISDIESGIAGTGGKYVKIVDRKEAIRYAIQIADCKDVILLAGKGHETYQDVGGCKVHMDERELIGQILEEQKDHVVCRCYS